MEESEDFAENLLSIEDIVLLEHSMSIEHLHIIAISST